MVSLERIMMDKKRIVLVLLIMIVIVGAMLGFDFLRRTYAASQAPSDMPPGSIPIYVDGEFVASFVPEDLAQLRAARFVDPEEGKTQEGWLFLDVILLYVDDDELKSETLFTVSSSSREKYHTLRWSEVADPNYIVMFDLSNKGTLKFVSNIPGFDIRDAWVQDVDKIEVKTP
jgi:hypothetical protein